MGLGLYGTGWVLCLGLDPYGAEWALCMGPGLCGAAWELSLGLDLCRAAWELCMRLGSNGAGWVLCMGPCRAGWELCMGHAQTVTVLYCSSCLVASVYLPLLAILQLLALLGYLEEQLQLLWLWLHCRRALWRSHPGPGAQGQVGCWGTTLIPPSGIASAWSLGPSECHQGMWGFRPCWCCPGSQKTTHCGQGCAAC